MRAPLLARLCEPIPHRRGRASCTENPGDARPRERVGSSRGESHGSRRYRPSHPEGCAPASNRARASPGSTSKKRGGRKSRTPHREGALGFRDRADPRIGSPSERTH
ncbi:hypothetical protein DB32_007460 [Sandaracinus amylolyticus]|uniref:Uncharacterized protein n=1 Tax=Sandaracinus amylolyticus TaxID=927083 RepID=A0A0F6W8T1_9BACT|nr:hypothetical protein DB32_007460 [Sandaracinus amylolyticus]